MIVSSSSMIREHVQGIADYITEQNLRQSSEKWFVHSMIDWALISTHEAVDFLGRELVKLAEEGNFEITEARDEADGLLIMVRPKGE